MFLSLHKKPIKPKTMKKVEMESKFSIEMIIRNRIPFMFEVLIGIISLPMILITTLCGYTVFIEVTPNKK
jgi:hypothetical protein